MFCTVNVLIESEKYKKMEEKKQYSDRRTAEEMYGLITRWRSSGQTRAEFCGEHQLKLHTFNYWLNKQRIGEASEDRVIVNEFVALPISEEDRSNESLQITYGNGAKIIFGVGTPVSYIRSLLQIQL